LMCSGTCSTSDSIIFNTRSASAGEAAVSGGRLLDVLRHMLNTIGRIGRKVGRWNIALQISKSGHFWRSDIAYLTTFAAQSRIIVEEKDFKIALLENMEGITWILADL
jgi:hypothetical protein